MKTFVELFVAARKISTPLVMVRTADNTSAIAALRSALPKETPLLSWDCVGGCVGLNDEGKAELAALLTETGLEQGATAAFPVFLGLLRAMKKAESDVVAFAANTQFQFAQEPNADAIQGTLNLRDKFKASGAMLVLLEGSGDELPVELIQHTLTLDQPLPTRDELATIVKNTFEYAAKAKTGAACKDAATPEVIKAAVDAGIGLPAFPFEQATATTLDKATGRLDIETLWHRKRTIVSSNRGLTYHAGKETLADMFGLANLRTYGTKMMDGKYSPTLVLRIDEIEKQFAGSQSDSSGTKGNLLGEFLTWFQERNIIGTLLLGVPGSSKSHFCYCIAGEYRKPVINYSLPGMEDSLVGNSAKYQRTAHQVLDAISDGRIWLIATANSLRGLPPELISRFQAGGIFFVDAPDQAEREGIMKLKVAKYSLDPKQTMPDMDDFTGRDIESCARRADMLNVPLVEAAKYVVPLLKSHKEDMQKLRESASGRFLSASKPGVYEYVVPSDTQAEAAAVGRRMR